MNKYFVEDHLTFSEKGFYLYGSRVNTLQPILTLFLQNKLYILTFSKGIQEE
jgi:hypothetical protein